MAEIVLRSPVREDAAWIAQHMRPADVAECHAVGKFDLEASLLEGMRTSPVAWTATVDGEPALMSGAAPLRSWFDDVGVPWMLGTHLVPKHQRALMRLSPMYIEKMLEVFPHLLNFVHAENILAVRWLDRMGFDIHPAAPYGLNGALFNRFEMQAHV